MTGAAKRGEYVELPGLESVGCEGVSSGQVEVAGEPGDPAEHVHRRDVQIGSFPLPGPDEPIDLVVARVYG